MNFWSDKSWWRSIFTLYRQHSAHKISVDLGWLQSERELALKEIQFPKKKFIYIYNNTFLKSEKDHYT